MIAKLSKLDEDELTLILGAYEVDLSTHYAGFYTIQLTSGVDIWYIIQNSKYIVCNIRNY